MQLNKKEMSTWQEALPHLQLDLLKPPVLHELAGALSVEPKQLEKNTQPGRQDRIVSATRKEQVLPTGGDSGVNGRYVYGCG